MPRKIYSRSCLKLIACIAMLLSPSPVSAHALEAIVRVTENALIVEAGYDDDTPASNAKVVIYDSHNEQILYEGTTNERGICTFSLPVAGTYRAEVMSTGHRTSVTFVVENVPREYRNWRPNHILGLILGVGGLLALTGISWWRLRRRTGWGTSRNHSSPTDHPMDANDVARDRSSFS